MGSNRFFPAIASALNGHRIWKTDPWKDWKWTVAQTERPIVIEFAIRNDSLTHFRDEVSVVYDNLGFARIDAKTGKIIIIGQD